MLVLDVAETELYDERKEEFVFVKPISLRLEHSLVSISKWESKWRKPFLQRTEPKTLAESRDYVRCMTLNQNVDPNVYYALTTEHFKRINEYIDSQLTATWFNNLQDSPSREIITSEVIYYQMVAFGIPFECQKWHLSRLLTLIRICNIKNNPGKKMSKSDILAQNKKLNAARRKAMHSRG